MPIYECIKQFPFPVFQKRIKHKFGRDQDTLYKSCLMT